MRREQRIVATGAASGIIVMLVALFGLWTLAPHLSAEADAGDRLAFAAQWIAIAAAPLFFAIVSVGNERFLSDAIDPTAGKESRAMIINGRVVDNTVQQYALFVVASLAVAAGARGDQLGIVAAAALVFLVMRFAFWIGYRIDPLYRAFGMSATAYLNLALFVAAVWMAVR
jgi:uncharacterized MAPEG superfamily protein